MKSAEYYGKAAQMNSAQVMNAAVIVKMAIALGPELYPNSSRLCSTLVGCIRLAGVYPRTLKLPRSERKSPLPLGLSVI